jgi:hypothetical protein
MLQKKADLTFNPQSGKPPSRGSHAMTAKMNSEEVFSGRLLGLECNISMSKCENHTYPETGGLSGAIDLWGFAHFPERNLRSDVRERGSQSIGND